MLIDSHCHLDAPDFDVDRGQIIAQSLRAGVNAIVIPAINVDTISAVQATAHSFQGGYYAVGIHPMYVRYAKETDLEVLERVVQAGINDKKLVAMGEIGLDFFVPEIKEGKAREKQAFFYKAQLKMAKRYGLPVLLHVRKSHDTLLKYLRQIRVIGGIAHAFNGSEQQAKAFIELGFCLGFGGAFTFTRALQLRRLAMGLGLEHIVLETDAPDMPPSWLTGDKPRNSPLHLPRIAEELAILRAISVDQLSRQTTQNVQRVLPRLHL